MRILVIEDYKPIRQSVVKGLREQGYAVDEAADGTEGQWLAVSGEYDVIILDLMLPEVDGFSILQKVRSESRNTSVLILTARDEVENRVRGLDMGADDYLVKPFAFEELLARVRTLVRRKYDSKCPTIRIADMVIDTTHQSVKRNGEFIELTAREFALLEYLALRMGEVVSRTDIWEHVYDFNSNATSNVVDVYIGYLRRKIERSGRPKLIHTRRGQGYVLGDTP
ncbi:MAG: response regulator transcription factor [Pirellulales bacterium]|nr:response regulator transcription factor [Pirellulales bacterium]